MRLTFQITLLFVAFLPFVLGFLTFIHGAVRFVPADMVTAGLDGQMRFSAVRSMLPFFLTIWIVRNLEAAQSVLAIVLAATALGGVARIISAIEYGMPGTATIGVIAFEIGVLMFLPWYRAVLRASEMTLERPA